MSARGATQSPPTPTLGRGRASQSRIAAGLLVAACVLASHASAQDLPASNRALAELEADANRLMNDPVRPHDLKSDTFVEERLADGELYLRLEDYLRAAILLTDIVDHHPTHRAYPEALFLLGESLFFAGDNLGARKRYAAVIDRGTEPTFEPYVQKSLSRLIEISIHTRDFRQVDGYLTELESRGTMNATTAYFRAKYYYNRAVPVDDVIDSPPDEPLTNIDPNRLEKARQGFLSVPAGSEFALRARYFVGAIHTLRGEYLDAAAAFQGVLGMKPAHEQEQAVVEQAYLALGRVNYETGQLEQAVEAYRAVPQTSPRFDEAMYELAWTYIRKGDAVQAERALELLSVAAPDSALNADGRVLRGDLLARDGRYDEAEVVFDEVLATFGPIRDDLATVQREHPDLHAYFRRVVRENLDDFDIDDFLPESARRWIDLEGDYERALGVLEDLSESKQLVRETDDLAARITAALDAPNRVSVFADLRRQRERTTALRNRAARVRGMLAEAEARARGGSMQGQLAKVTTRRRKLQSDIMKLPAETEDFVERDIAGLSEFRKAERDLQGLRVEVLGLEARITASHMGLASVDPQKVDPTAVRAELADHQAQIADYETQLTWIRRRLEVGRLGVGVGDERYQTDDEQRARFIELIDRERQLRPSGGPDYDAAFSRVAALERQLDQRDAEVASVIEQRVSEMRGIVAEESAKLRGYRASLGSFDRETEDVVGAVTSLNFNRVYDRFYDLVLRADVGKVDVSWARREQHRLRIDALTRERARELQALDDEFRDVMDENIVDEESP